MKKQYKHLTLDDRTLIQTQLQQGFKPAQIADSLNRLRSCISTIEIDKKLVVEYCLCFLE